MKILHFSECFWETCNVNKSRFCHNTESFIFKDVTPFETDKKIFVFLATAHKAKFNENVFEIIRDENKYVLKLKKALDRDEMILLKIKDGRMQHTKHIKVFRSDL